MLDMFYLHIEAKAKTGKRSINLPFLSHKMRTKTALTGKKLKKANNKATEMMQNN